MTDTAKRLLIIGALLIAGAGGVYLYLVSSSSGTRVVQDF